MRPGLGVGGYCITKDPDFINFSAKFFSSARLSFPITNIAKKINEAMPNTSINFIKSKIKNIKKRNVLILGAAYKQDVSDIRYSPTVNLINYFTSGVKETRSWTIKQNTLAPSAAGKIHSDFEKGFIRAETIAYNDFINLNGELACREAGKLRQEGKDYIVKDGDIMNFLFNV